MFQRLQTFLGSAFRRKREELRLAITDYGVTLFSDSREVWQFRWEEVTRIETYKRDMLTVDLICVDFFVDSQKLTYPTHDEMQGFDALSSHLHRYFPTIVEDWWPQVAFPPFATNHRVLYERKTA